MLRVLSPVVVTYAVSALLCLHVLLPFVIAYAFWVECCYMVCECDLVFPHSCKAVGGRSRVRLAVRP